MNRSVLTVAIMFAAFGCATAGHMPRAHDPAALQLKIGLVRAESSSVVINIGFTNITTRSLEVSKTHGYGSTWLRFEITDEAGRPVRYPSSVPEFVLRSPPKYQCLRPGETLTWEIDLLDWSLVFGGEWREDRHRLDLDPQAAYRLTAVYSDVPRHSRDCPPIAGESRSNVLLIPRRQ